MTADVSEQLHILILLDRVALTDNIQAAVEHFEATVSVKDISIESPQPEELEKADIRIVVTASACDSSFIEGISPILVSSGEDWCPTIVLSPMPTEPMLRQDSGTASGMVHHSSQLLEQELVQQLDIVVQAARSLASLRAELADSRKREREQREMVEVLEVERRQAAEIQSALLPTELPKLESASVQACFRPVDTVSGDLYDVFRLDDKHVAILVLDATGHGTAPALLSTKARQLLQDNELLQDIANIQPNEILEHLNEAITDIDLAECQFVATIFAVYNEESQKIRWARGGAPYPMLVRKGQKPCAVHSAGPIIGAFHGAEFETAELSLHPGDAIVFHSDGLDGWVSSAPERSSSSSEVTNLPWLKSLSHAGLKASMDKLESMINTPPSNPLASDDVTVVALQLSNDATPTELSRECDSAALSAR